MDARQNFQAHDPSGGDDMGIAVAGDPGEPSPLGCLESIEMSLLEIPGEMQNGSIVAEHLQFIRVS